MPPDLSLHPCGNVQRDIGRGAACTPSDVTEDRAVRDHALLPLEQVLNAL